jgi:AcrR family transcriptional regulator
MARIVKEEKFAARRNEIITVAQRLVYTKGYEQMAIQDILDELHISKGAFYHYFGSKVALLEALIEKMKEEALQLIIPIVEDPHLPTLEKIQRFFDTAARWKTARKTYILSLVRVWYADENAIVRQKVLTKVIIETAPLLTGIIRQGIQEGILNTPFPDQAGEIVLFLMQSLGDAFIPLLLSGETKGDEFQRTESLVAAYTDALERILGAPTGSLQLIDTATLKEWVPSPT